MQGENLFASTRHFYIVTGFGLACLPNVDPNPDNMVGTGILKTKAAQVGSLLRLEPNAKANVSFTYFYGNVCLDITLKSSASQLWFKKLFLFMKVTSVDFNCQSHTLMSRCVSSCVCVCVCSIELVFFCS